MDVVELSRRLSPRALRRLFRRYRKQLVAGASLAAAAAFSIMLSIPVFAHDGETKTPPAACDFTTLPLTSACAAMITAPTTTAGAYVVTLPGSGTLTIMIDATGAVVSADVAGLVGFTASVPTIDKDKDKVSVTLTSTDGTQVIKVRASVKPPATAGLPATVKAKVKPAENEDAEEANEASEANKPTDNDSANNTLSDHKGGGGREHGGGGGDH